jgi:hypothetical protein
MHHGPVERVIGRPIAEPAVDRALEAIRRIADQRASGVRA